jgi:hypothetical protein
MLLAPDTVAKTRHFQGKLTTSSWFDMYCHSSSPAPLTHLKPGCGVNLGVNR